MCESFCNNENSYFFVNGKEIIKFNVEQNISKDVLALVSSYFSEIQAKKLTYF